MLYIHNKNTTKMEKYDLSFKYKKKLKFYLIRILSLSNSMKEDE